MDVILDIVWMSFGGCLLKVFWVSFGCLKPLDSHNKHQELALLVVITEKAAKGKSKLHFEHVTQAFLFHLPSINPPFLTFPVVASPVFVPRCGPRRRFEAGAPGSSLRSGSTKLRSSLVAAASNRLLEPQWGTNIRELLEVHCVALISFNKA